MAGELTTDELACAAVRASTPRAAARWLTRAFLEARFQGRSTPQVGSCVRLARMARTERDSLVLLPAYATDGILAADARSQGAGRQLRRAVALFEEDFDALPSSHRDPLWVELIGHVRVTRGEEREVHDLVRPSLADGSIGAAQRQRLECLLAAAELGCGHLFQAAAALTEAAVPTGMVDQERTRWAELTLGQLTGARRDSAGLSSEELRVLAAVEEGLDDAQTAHRLALSTRAVRFYRSLVQEKLTARHRSA